MSENTIIIFLSLTGLFFLWVFGWKAYYLDNYRHNLFLLRDELFRLAASGAIDFNDGVYTKMRHALNLKIHFAHRLSFFYFIWMLIGLRIKPMAIPNYTAERFLLIKKIENQSLKGHLASIEDRSDYLSTSYLLQTSLTFRLVINPFFLLLSLPHICIQFLRKKNSEIEQRRRNEARKTIRIIKPASRSMISYSEWDGGAHPATA